MKLTVDLKDETAEAALAWIRRDLARHDLSRLSWIRVNRGRSRRYIGLYGRCWLPTSRLPFYRISCQLPGPFPFDVPVRRSPIYRRPDGGWPSVPPGCRLGVRCADPATGRAWRRIIGFTRVEDTSEAVVWIYAHEMFHFLRETSQIGGRNTEIEADGFADRQLVRFRHWRAGARVRGAEPATMVIGAERDARPVAARRPTRAPTARRGRRTDPGPTLWDLPQPPDGAGQRP